MGERWRSNLGSKESRVPAVTLLVRVDNSEELQRTVPRLQDKIERLKAARAAGRGWPAPTRLVATTSERILQAS